MRETVQEFSTLKLSNRIPSSAMRCIDKRRRDATDTPICSDFAPSKVVGKHQHDIRTLLLLILGDRRPSRGSRQHDEQKDMKQASEHVKASLQITVIAKGPAENILGCRATRLARREERIIPNSQNRQLFLVGPRCFRSTVPVPHFSSWCKPSASWKGICQGHRFSRSRQRAKAARRFCRTGAVEAKESV